MNRAPGCRSCGLIFPGAHVHELCATCFRTRLAERYPRDVVEELFPEGCYEQGDREYRAGSFAGEPGRALVIAIGGPKSGLWHDFKSGEGGDLIGLIAQVRCNGDRRETLQWARQWLGQPERRRSARPIPVHDPHAEDKTREIAKRIWDDEAVPLSRGDLVCRYLAGRKIDLEKLAQTNDGKFPPTLRFHRRLWNEETRRCYPAMVAAIVGPDGEFLAVHRTWLVEDENGCVDKADLEAPKMTLGHYRLAEGAGCVRLWRRKWREATEEDWLGLSEGIEDALTGALVYPHWRVAAGVSLSALLRTWVPPVITRIVMIEQNDQPGSPAAALLPQVRERFHREGREVWRWRAPPGIKDVNDAAMRFWRHR